MPDFDHTYGGIGGLWFSDLRDLVKDYDEDVNDDMRIAAYHHHKKRFEKATAENKGQLPEGLLAELTEAAMTFCDIWGYDDPEWHPELGGFVVETYKDIDVLVDDHGDETAVMTMKYVSGDEFLEYYGDLHYDAEAFFDYYINEENEQEIWRWLEDRAGEDLLGSNVARTMREEGYDFMEVAEELGVEDELKTAAAWAAADGYRSGTEAAMFQKLTNEIQCDQRIPGFIHVQKHQEGHEMWWEPIWLVYTPEDMLLALVSDLDIEMPANVANAYMDVYYYGWWGTEHKIQPGDTEWECDKELANEYFPDALAQQG